MKSIPTQSRISNVPIRIVVADDHPIVCDSLCRLLSMEEDFEVVAHALGSDVAVALVRQHAPNILLLDLCMPGENGLATLQRVRTTTPSTRTIIVTAETNPHKLAEAARSGVFGIVAKGSSSEALFHAIRRVNEGDLWFDAETAAAVVRLSADEGADATRHPDEYSVDPLSSLSGREREIARLVADGLKYREIAEVLAIGEQTVKNHLCHIFRKIGVANRTGLRALMGSSS